MPNRNPSPTLKRDLLWLIFRAPGALLLWVEYHWPRSGDTWASARRYGQPVFEIIYSLGFWLGVTGFLWVFFSRPAGHG